MKKSEQPQEKSATDQAAELMATIERVRKLTDGCTNSPDFNFTQCCIEHDLYYHEGSEKITRAEADARLRRCIREKGFIILPWIYWAGVRLFGRGNWKK